MDYWVIGTVVAGIGTVLLFVAFCMRHRLHRHKFDRTLDAMNETQRFRGAKEAAEFSAGLERAFRAVGVEPKFTPPSIGSGVSQLLPRRKEPPPGKADGAEQHNG